MHLDSMDPAFHEFARRMVTLISYEQHPDKSGVLVLGGGSGFVIEVGGTRWLITAGHVIQGLLKAANEERLVQLIACDAWAGPDGKGRPNVLPRDTSRWWHIGDGDTLDLGVIEIGPLIAACFEAGHIIPVPEEDWRNPQKDFDFYLLLGTPEETRGPVVPPGGQFPVAYDLKQGLIEVERIPRPAYADVTAHERFYGKLNREGVEGGLKLDSIVGVSGGPIFGCKRLADGSLRSWVIAVQSGWYKDTKVIFADFLTTVAEAIAVRNTPLASQS